jgi:hypothetical protein
MMDEFMSEELAEAYKDYFYDKGNPAIRILFAIECCSRGRGINIWPGGWDSNAGKETREWLKVNGLIDPETEDATARGVRWVTAICNTPLPEAVDG